jgi:CheY-like chemotaxis protein
MTRILVVDDAELLRALQGSFVNRPSCVLHVAGDAGEIPPLAREVPPDVIVIRVDPDPVLAFEACRAIKREAGLRDVPLICVAAGDDAERCSEAGANVVLTRPIDANEVVGTLRRLLGVNGRAVPRRSASLRVDYYSSRGEGIAYTKDVAESGLFLKTSAALAPGDTLQLLFDLPGPTPARVRAKGDIVRRIEGDRDSHLIPGVGVTFRRLGSRDRAELARFVGEGGATR